MSSPKQQQQTSVAGANSSSPSEVNRVATSRKNKRKQLDHLSFDGGILSESNNDDSRDDIDLENEQKLEERTKEMQPKSVLLYNGSKADTAFFVDDVLTRFEELWPEGLANPPDILKATIELKSTPYLETCLKVPLDEAQHILSSNVDQAQLTDKDHELLRLIPEGSIREQVRQSFVQKAIQASCSCSKIRASCFRILVQVNRTTTNVRVQLLALAGLSQAEGTLNQTSEAVSKSPRTKDGISSRRGHLAPAEPQNLYSAVTDENYCVDIEKVLPRLCQPLLSDGDAERAAEKVKILADHLEEFLSKCTFLSDGDTNYEVNVLEGLNSLQGKLCTGGSSRSSSTPTTTFAPGPVAQEKDGTQPYFQLLLQAIGECWDPSAHSSSPAKNSFRKEAPIPSTLKRHRRFVDFLFQKKETRFEPVIFDDTLTVPVEVKPGRRKGSRAITLLNEARDQVLSHLAKHLFIGFNFATYGVPCQATGILGNMAAVQVLQLRYEDCGSPKARLVLYQSNLLPLMSLQNFRRWATEADVAKELEEMLFGPSGEGGMDENGIPKGIRMLLNLMHKPSTSLHGLSVRAESNELGAQLGFGAAAVVFRRRDSANSAAERDSVVKTSRFGIKTDIRNETEILQELASSSAQANKHIPTIVDSKFSAIKNGMLQIKLGSVLTNLPAIETSPAGKKAASLFVLPPDKKSMWNDLRIVRDGIISALNYMHNQKILHCDVTPKNIIIASDGPAGNERRAVLIDYSISHKMDKKMKGFRGTPNYVHRELFQFALRSNKALTPNEKHDKAGLGFTLAFFANRCVLPWSVGDYPKSMSQPKEDHMRRLDNTMEERLADALDVVERAGVDSDLKAKIEGLLRCDQPEDAG